jgi:hypothetical protein
MKVPEASPSPIKVLHQRLLYILSWPKNVIRCDESCDWRSQPTIAD